VVGSRAIFGQSDARYGSIILVESARRSVAKHSRPSALVGGESVDVNEPLAALLSAATRDLRTRTAWRALGADDAARAAIDRALAGDADDAPVELVCPDGERRMIAFSAFPLEEGVLLAIRDVTESVRAQSDRDRFFEVAKDLLLVVSADGAIVRASTSFLEAVGLTRDAVEGSMLSDHIHPEDRGAARTCFADLFVNATHCDLELRLRRSDGTSRWIAWRCPPADAGRVHVVGRDVTGEREARVALALAERQFQAIFDESPIATAAVSTTGRFFHVNDAFCRLTGYGRDELSTLRFADLSGGFPEDVERNMVLFESALRGERDHYELEKRYRRKDGSSVWVHLTVGVLREPSGAVRALVAQAQDIDARREAEAALRASECLFREFAESLDGVAWVTDPDREEFLFVSTAFERLWGHPPRDVATERVAWLDAVHPDDRERVIAATRRLPTEAFDIEYRARRRDGQLRWVRERALPIPGATGDVLRIAGFSQDVTANKTVLESLRASEERYRRLLKVLPDAVVALSSEARVVEANMAAATLLGAAAERAITGARVEDFLEWVGDDAEGELRELVAHKVRVDCVLRHARRRSDGAELAIEVSAAPFEDEPGATVVLRDVTRRLEVEGEVQRQREELVAVRALHESDARLREIIDLVPHFIFAKDLSGRFLLANRAVAETFGTTVQELEGRTDDDFATPEEARRFRADDRAVIESGKAKLISEETITDHAGETRVLSTIKIPFSFAGSGTAAVLGVSTDVTERRRLETQLAHAQKLEGLGRLAGGIAHDFNNGLGAILMFSELLVLRLGGHPDLRADAEAIRDVALRSADLTRDLLAFSRQGDVSPTAVDVGELLARLRRLLQKVVGDDVRVTLPPPPPGFVVRVDVGRLEQVLVNLAINARDAMPKGGVLAITLREVDPLELQRRTGTRVAGGHGWIEIGVTDTGVGMSSEILARAFEPFFTTKPVGKGTGLGLATSYGFVKQAGGHLVAESTPGEGTTFRIFLPTSEEAAASSGTKPTSALRGRETLLLVEDNAFVRQATTRALVGAGFTVVACALPEEALRVLASARPPIDILVTDVVMPQMNGYALAAEARRARPGIRVLYISGYGGEDAPREGDGAPVLQKPFSSDKLVEAVRAAIDVDRAPASSAAAPEP